MELREPPFIESLLFENPWPAIAAIGAVGATMLWLARARGNRSQAIVGAAALAIAVALFVVSSLVSTDREQCVAETEKLVAAITPLRMNEIRSLLDGRVLLTAQGEARESNDVFAGLEEVSSGDRYGLESNTIKKVAAESINESHVRVLFTALTVAQNGRVTTRWLLDWHRIKDGPWRVTAIEWLPATDAVLGIAPNIGYLPRNTAEER